MDKASGLPLDLDSVDIAKLKLKLMLDNIKKRLQDWPNLNYYRRQNALLIPCTNRVVLMGDSTFENWSNLGNQNWVNRGICGQTTPQILLRFRSDVIKLCPAIVFIVGGANDIGLNTGPITFEETTGNIRSMAELASVGQIRVVLCSVLPTSNYRFVPANGTLPQTVKRPVEKIVALNSWIREYAGQNGHGYVDYFSAFIDANGMLAEHLSDDDLHPNVVGYKIMEKLTEDAISKL